MKTFKRILSSLLVAVMLLTVAPLTGFVGLELNLNWPNFDWIDFNTKASAESYSGTCGANLTWTLDTETGELSIDGTGTMYDYLDDSPPWSIGGSSIKKIIIGNGVTKIGGCAFTNCSNSISIMLPASIERINGDAFFYTDIETVYYDGTVEDWVSLMNNNGSVNGEFDNVEIVFLKEKRDFIAYGNSYYVEYGWVLYADGELVISGRGEIENYSNHPDSWENYCSSVKKVTIKEGITSIGYCAFYHCTSLTSITIPDSVTSIGGHAFYNCPVLTDVYYTGDIESWCKISFNDLYSNPMCYGDNLYINGKLIEGDLVIPEGVTTIGDFAFCRCTNLTSVKIPDSVTSIGSSAFYICMSLTSVTIGNSVTSIGDDAFLWCRSLTSVTIPASVTSIGSSAFSECSNSLVFELEKDSYAETYAKGKSILYYYVYNESEEKIISATVTSRLSFEINKETYTMTINCVGNMPAFTNEDAPWAQYKPYIKHIIINDGCTSVSGNAFKNFGGLKSIIIPDSVTTIGSYAFYNCDNLENITIPDGLTSINDRTFYNCTSLTNIAIPDSVTSIGDSAFSYCTSLTSIAIPDGVTSIGSSAFSNCRSLTSIAIPDSVTSISGYAFYNCTSLTSITIPDSVTIIVESAFYNCTSLTSITIPDSVRTIGYEAFLNCTGLTSVTIPISAYIDSYAFSGCTRISKITVTKGDGTVQSYTSSYYQRTPWYISQCPTVIIEDGVTAIGSYMFYGCSNLESVTLPNSVQSIGNNAFAGCQKMEKLKVYNRNCIFGTNATSYYTTIVGYAGSTAEAYANEMGFNFELISDGDHEHIYSNLCDNECNICGYVNPDAGHTYDNDCDAECNRCGFIRMPSHTDTDNNGICEVCGIVLSDIQVGAEQKVVVNAGETVYIKFVPINSGVYTFFSSGTADTYGYVCDADKNILASDDDAGEGNNFSITYTFKSRTVYYLAVRDYSSSNSSEIPVTIRLDQLICDHNNTHEGHKDSTCSEKGYDKVICDDCGQTLSETELELLDHSYKTVVANPTCIDEGSVVCFCTMCRYAYVVEITDPLGHSGDWKIVTHPTTSTDGIKIFTCSTCDEVVEAKILYAIKVSKDSIASIDFTTNTIYGLTAGITSLDNYLVLENGDYRFVCDDAVIGTGSVIKLTDGETVIREFTAVVYGDANGDSWYDGQDSVFVSCLANGMLSQDDVSEAVYIAADCNHDGVIDQLDVDLLNQAGTLLANVDQSKPAEVLLETSSAYVEYLDLIDQSPEIEIEDETDTPEADADTTPEQDKTEVNIFEMIINFIKSIIEMILSRIPVPYK